MHVAVVGGGLAGLVAACTAIDAGAHVTLIEQASQLGGTSVMSSGWLWIYDDTATLDDAGATEYRMRHAGFQQDLDWLSRITQHPLGNPIPRPGLLGFQFDLAAVIAGLAAHVGRHGSILCNTSLTGIEQTDDGLKVMLETADLGQPSQIWTDKLIVAGGGYAADLFRVAEFAGVEPSATQNWIVRNAGLSTGTTIDGVVAVGGEYQEHDNGACYCRLVPVISDNELPLSPREWAELAPIWTGPDSGVRLRSERGYAPIEAYEDWSGSAAAWWLAQRGSAGMLEIPEDELDRPTVYGSIRDVLERIERRGGAVGGATDRSLPVIAGITHSLSGLRTRQNGSVPTNFGHEGGPIYAAGADAAQPLTSHYASGLAWALVTGRSAGKSAAQAA